MAKKKKIAGFINLIIKAGMANPSPPIGPALGQHGVNIMEFCKAFNAQTESVKGQPTPVVITVFEDRSFSFITKTPPASYLITQELKLAKGSGAPNRDPAIGQIRKSQLKKIAETKMKDLNANDIEAAIKIIAGTARSMGVDVVEG